MEIGVLGPVEVWFGAESVQLGGPKQRGLLALLVASSPRPVSTDVLIEGIWGEEPSSGARSTLQTYVSNLRHVLGDVLIHERGGYRLDVDDESVDAIRFQVMLEEGRSRVTTDPAATAVSLRKALSLWRGRPYADLIDVPGLEPEVRRLEELRLEAVELRIDAELASGLHGSLIAELEALAEDNPTREHLRAQHMLALYRSGRQAEALRAYRRTESFLSEELGVDPSRELQELELRILQHDESLLADAGRAVTQRLAFLVTQIEGAARHWDRDPQGMADALATHDRLLREQIESAGGRVFQHTGDGVLAVFPGPMSAVSAAENALRALAGSDWRVGELKVRMGIDVGEAETSGGDFFGPPLSRAARLCAIGHGGQVLISSAAQAEVNAAAPAGLQVRHLGEVHLRGMAAPESVAQLIFAGLPADFPALRVDAESDLDQRLDVVSVPGYEVRDRIGEGALGVVWRAYQPSVGREVAIRVIQPELASQADFVRRFEAEARTIARLAHPHIVPLIDYWRDTNSAYLVVGLLPGGSLADLLGSGTVDRRQARQILAQVGSALDHAHSQGVVHGDLKPSNILFDGARNAYLSDFGLAARLLVSDTPSASLSRDYRASEEAETRPSPAGDLFDLGVLARSLFAGEPELNAVFARATASRSDDRYQSASEFLTELDRALGSEPDQPDVPVVSRNPYKGLRAFDEGDSADFFGRDELIGTMVAALSENRFVTMVGPSGSGKSSALRAGLLPALARGAVDGSADWIRTVFTPGREPVVALTDAIEAVSTEPVDREELEATGIGVGITDELLLVVDQFEELYTLTVDPEQRDLFIDLITRAVEHPNGQVRVVVTLRADFYDHPLVDSRLGRLVRDGLVTILPPTRDELVEMILAPSQTVGLRWEPGLVHRIVEDVFHQPGVLPLLQYGLTELVERRGGDLLTADDYRRVHGVAGALANRAEALYRDLTSSQQEAARQVLLRLVIVDEETDDTRRRVRRTELESIGIPRADLDAVLDTFITRRLLLADRDAATRGPTVEVAHEALIREWPRVRRWVDDHRDALILGRRFRIALDDWVANGHDEDYLLTGSRLAPFVGWAETTSLSAEEQTYYRASRHQDDKHRLARRRRRFTLIGILAGAAVVASTLGVLAAVQADRATEEARRARASELAASALNAIDTDPGLSKLLAVASADLADPPVGTLSVLHRAWAADRIASQYSWPTEDEVGQLWTDIHPDGDRLVGGGASVSGAAPSSHLEVASLTDGEILWSFVAEDPAIGVDSPMFTFDGAQVVAGLTWHPSDDEPSRQPPDDRLGVLVWDAETGEALNRFDVGACGGLLLDISPTHLLVGSIHDGEQICFSGLGGENELALELVNLDSGERQLLTTSSFGFGATSGDGRRVAFNDESGTDPMTVVVDVATGERLLEFDPNEHPGPSLGDPHAMSYDGSLLLAGDRPVAVWDVAAGEVIATFDAQDGAAWDVEFLESDNSVFSIGQSGTLHHWDALSGNELAAYPAVGAGRLSVTDDRVLVTDWATRTAALVDVGPRGEVWAIPTCGGFVLAGTLNVRGAHAVFAEACPDQAVNTVVVDIPRREVAYKLDGHNAQGLAVAPDGTRFVRQERIDPTPGDGEVMVGDWVGPVSMRDLESGEMQLRFDGVCTFDSGSSVRWNDQNGCASYPERPFPMLNWSLEWSADSQYVAAIGQVGPTGPGVVIVWDTNTGQIVHEYGECLGHDLEDILFASELVVFCNGRLLAFETGSWELLRSASTDFDGVIVGNTPDRSSLIVLGRTGGDAGWSILWMNSETFDIETSAENVFDGTPKAWRFNRDGTLVAIGTSDGFVKVWDVEQRRIVHEIFVGVTQAQGVAFLDDRHIAVTPQDGGFYVYTIDPDELISLVRESLSRGFTPTECDKFDFGDTCPTLEELRSEEYDS